MKKLSSLSILLVCSMIHMMAQIIKVPTDKATIQTGIDAASTGDTVLVAEGTYYENINFLGKAITVASPFILDGDTSHISKTIIDGSHFSNPDSSSTVSFCSGEDTTSILKGFTITGGMGTNYIIVIKSYIFYSRGGGGVYMKGSGGKIENNHIIGNQLTKAEGITYYYGGGIFASLDKNHSAVIRNNLIQGNSVTGENVSGGGISTFIGRILIEGNSIKYNTLAGDGGMYGGGIHCEPVKEEGEINEVVIRNNLISYNSVNNRQAFEGGGGINLGDGFFYGLADGWKGMEVIIYNNIVHNNFAHIGPAGARFSSCFGSVFNNTIVNNSANVFKGDVGMIEIVDLKLYNNIIWSTDVMEGPGIGVAFTKASAVQVFNNMLPNPFESGAGIRSFDNIYGEPIFEPGTFNLVRSSRGIGRGIDSVQINDTWYFAPSTDYYGNVRPNPASSHPDLGAIESQYEGFVYIPDTAFLYALIDVGADANGDGLISYAEAEAIITLMVDDRNISDMTGIEAFVSLDTLSCGGNLITGLDLSENVLLRYLYCSDNQLTHLNIASNSLLTLLYCENNLLTNLDVSENDSLRAFNCRNNELSSLDVSNKTELSKFLCENNLLKSLDVSNTGVRWLMCSNNQLTDLDVTTCPLLRRLSCSNNKLTTLDISRNPEILAGCPGGSGMDISYMPSLYQVCVQGLPFPPSYICVEVIWTGSPNVYFTTECSDYLAPEIIAVDTLYQPEDLEVTCSENGMIYLVPLNTWKDLEVICGACVDSVEAVMNTPVNISLEGIVNGTYWLYARDTSGNISEPKAITILGVGIEQRNSDNLRIYPNPTYNMLIIETANSDMINIEITSMKGQLILSKEMEGTTHQIDLSSYRNGVYLITIRSKDFVTTRKIVKQ